MTKFAHFLCSHVRLTCWIGVFVTLVMPFICLGESQAQRIRDAEIEHVLSSYQSHLYSAAGLNAEDASIVLINNLDINAFVQAGRNIYLYSGLVIEARSLGELIGVLSHEMAHIVGGHVSRRHVYRSQMSKYATFGLIAGSLLGVASGRADVGVAIASAGADVSKRKVYAHSRGEESLADRDGLTFMDRLNFPLGGLQSFTEKMSEQEFMPTSQQQEYYRTHPSVRSRLFAIRQTRKTLEAEPKVRQWPEGWEIGFERMRAKLTGYLQPQHALRVYKDRSGFVAGYGRGIAFLTQKAFDSAHAEFEILLKEMPQDAWVHELVAETWFAAGNVEQATEAIRRAMSYANDEPDLLERAALMFLALGTDQGDAEAERAVSLALQKRYASPSLWRLKAQIHGKRGETSLADLAFAESAFSSGDSKRAVIFARRALKGFKEGGTEWLRAQDILLIE